MDLEKARFILSLPNEFSEKDAKKQYHRLILKYHPDKSQDKDNVERFRDVREAYIWLCNNFDYDMPRSGDSHSDYVTEFMTMMLGPDAKEVLKGGLIAAFRDEKMMEKIIRTLPDSFVFKCYYFLSEYRDILGIAHGAMNALEKSVKIRESGYAIVRPTIDDLFCSNVVRLDKNGETYFIPSWHSEVTFESENGETIIKCLPELPDHVSIDPDNNIHLHVKTSIASLLEKQALEIRLGQRMYRLDAHKLRVTQHQSWCFVGEGIPRINEEDIYDDSIKGDLLIEIKLV